MSEERPNRLLQAGPSFLVPAEASLLPAGSFLSPAAPPPGPSPTVPSRATLMRDSFTILFRHKARAVAFLAATVATAWFFTAREAATYTSEAMMLLRQGRENVSLDPTVTTGEMSPVRQEWDQTMNSEVAILRSRELTEEVTDRLGPATLLASFPPRTPPLGGWRLRERLRRLVPGVDPAPAPPSPGKTRNAAITLLSDAVKVEAMERSNVIRVSCTLGNPDLAQRVVTEMLALCGARHTAAYSRPGSLEFFQAQTADCRQRLRQADEALRRTKNELCIASLETEREATAKRIAELRTQKETLDDRLAAALVTYTALGRKIEPDAGEGPMPSPEAFKVRRQALLAAELAYHSLQQEAAAAVAHLAAALAVLKTLNPSVLSGHFSSYV